MSLPSAANTLVRSVRTPRVIVSPSTPMSVCTSAAAPASPPPPPPELSGALVLQPPAVTARAAASIVAPVERLLSLTWHSLVLVRRTGRGRRDDGGSRCAAG